MDGISGVASGMAVASLAIQLGGNIKQLHDFWASVKDASDDIHTITIDLSLLSSVLAEMAFEEQHFRPDPTLTIVLETCNDRVNKLIRMTSDIEPGFASRSLRMRKWTAFKAVLKGEKIQRFQKVLECLKTTLMLAQLNRHSRLNRTRDQSQQKSLIEITTQLSSIKLEQMSAPVNGASNNSSIGSDHINTFHGKTSRICQTIQNSAQHLGFELDSDVAVQKLASSLFENQGTTSWSPANPEIDSSTLSYRNGTSRRPGQQTLTKKTLDIRDYVTENLFGSVITTTKTHLLKQKFVGNEALDDGDYQYEHESSSKILPAQWLLKLGFNYAYTFSTNDSSTQGWRWKLEPINLVPHDASILMFCRQGNIEGVRGLISKGLASARDVTPHGLTALHLAARSHNPELCRFLIEAGADKNAQTFCSWFPENPLVEIAERSITKDGLVNAIDTCRIFEASFAFWDQDGEGWDVLQRVPMLSCDGSTADVKATLTFLKWLIQSSAPDIKANYSTEKVANMISNASPGIADAVHLLLKLGPPGAIDKLELTPFCKVLKKGTTMKIYHASPRRWDGVKWQLTLGANRHRVCFNRYYSPIAETPLSLAMYSSWMFLAFRDALRETDLDIQDFAREELKQGYPLLDAGWQMETLSTLLGLDFEPDIEPLKHYSYDIHCNRCNKYFLFVNVQPHWQHLLESIKNRTYQQKSCSDTRDEQSPSRRSQLSLSSKESLVSTTHRSMLAQDSAFSEEPDEEPSTGKDNISRRLPDREEVVCTWCWHAFKTTGRPWSPDTTETQSSDRDDPSEDEYSPLLFNT